MITIGRERMAKRRCAAGWYGVGARDDGTSVCRCWLSHRRGVHAGLSVYIDIAPSRHAHIRLGRRASTAVLDPRPRHLPVPSAWTFLHSTYSDCVQTIALDKSATSFVSKSEPFIRIGPDPTLGAIGPTLRTATRRGISAGYVPSPANCRLRHYGREDCNHSRFEAVVA